MNLRDMVFWSLSTLWGRKLRSLLTISGVLIGIGTLVTMLAMAEGMERNVREPYESFGMLHTIQVFPGKAEEEDTTAAPLLDDEALERFTTLRGVRMAFPMSALAVTVSLADSTLEANMLPLPGRGLKAPMFQSLLAGRHYGTSEQRVALLTGDLCEELGQAPDEILGETIYLSAKFNSLDSAYAELFESWGGLPGTLGRFPPDSLFDENSRSRLLTRRAGEALQHMMQGYASRSRTVRDSFTVVGVLATPAIQGNRLSVLLPPDTTSGLFGQRLPSEPTALYSAMREGTLFQVDGGRSGGVYDRATVVMDLEAPSQPVVDSLRVMGYQVRSFAEEFGHIRRFFLYFRAGLLMIGAIALLVAALGIMNTMFTAILERTREIGVLKSLGADGKTIRLLFLVESGVIGFVGALAGIAGGYVACVVGNLAAGIYLAGQELEEIGNIFVLDLPIVLFGLLFGVTISVLAGLHPAARAAKLEAVEALRGPE